MRILTSKSKAPAVALILMLTIAATLICLPIAAAQDETEIVECVANLSFRPNPIGITQTLLVNVWVSPSCPDPLKLSNYTVEFTKPDNSKYTQGPFDAIASDNSAWFEIVVDQTGTWKIQFKSPEQLVEGWTYPFMSPFPVWESLLYEACESPVLNLTVQQDPVPSWPASALPTDYWEHPVHPENREWACIAGDWPMNHYDTGSTDCNPYSTGPESSHILWKFQTAIGGIIGGDWGTISYQGGPSATVAMAGYTFVTLEDGKTYAINMHTGEVMWTEALELGFFAALTGMVDVSVSTFQGYEPMLVTISGGRLLEFDVFTGALRVNATGLSGTFVPPYVYSVQNIGTFVDPDYRLIKWDATGWPSFWAPENFTARIAYNVSYPFPSISRISSDGTVGSYFTYPGLIGAFNATDGSILWSRNATKAERSTVWGELLYDMIVYTMYYPDTTSRVKLVRAIDIYTGTEKWRSEPFAYPWGTFQEYDYAAAYGLIYVGTYAGIYALNATTGKIEWHFSDTPEYAYEIPYSQGYPFFSFGAGHCIADGKFYKASGEHSPTQPRVRGFKLFCINANSGDEIWSIDGITTCGSGFGDISQNALIAYGILVIGNTNDNYLYAFGRGPSETTLSVSSQTVEKGNSVLITGTVTDQSPAQPDTPCVSKESMSDWMEYLHMQKPMPTSVTGVPVDLIAVHEDGSYVTIGTATSDLGGFRHEWAPPDEGIYTITASFNGDESYGSSWAAADVLVTPEPPAPPEPEPEAEPAYLAIDLAIIAAVAVVAILVVYDIVSVRKLRK